MCYLKIDVFDNYQNPMTLYKVIEFSIDEANTIIESKHVFQNQIWCLPKEVFSGNQEEEICLNHIRDGWIECSQTEYNSKVCSKMKATAE
ncbi:MAG: hypothetical protein J0L66_15925 [Cytophagales bacterium]|nr:hypothetical protein [Cytophagales bacterium]